MPNAENGLPDNFLAPDGYRYGVMFHDGSVIARWNGKTQRRRASEYARNCAADFHPDNITLARWKPGDEWYTRVVPPAGRTITPTVGIRPDCPTCTWPNRETVNMVCQTCGFDYGTTTTGEVTRVVPPGWNPTPPEGGYTAEDF